MLPILVLLAQIVLFCNADDVKVVPIDGVKTKLGESPVYVAETNSLVYTDVLDQCLLRYSLDENKIYSAKVKGESEYFGFIIPIDGYKDKFAVGSGRDVKIVKWDGITTEAEVVGTQLTVDTDRTTNHIHDSKVDPLGNLFLGTLRNDLCNPNSTKPAGSLFRSRDGQTAERVIGDMNAPNDFAIDEYKKTLYCAGTCKTTIRAYDWDKDTGEISNMGIAYDFKTKEGEKLPYAPDGVVLDTKGNLYVTVNGGGYVAKIDPVTGTELQKIYLPDNVKTAQTLTFGGKDLDILFITSTEVPFNVMDGKPYYGMKVPPSYGKLYKATGLGVKGRPAIHLSKKFATSAPE